MLKYTIHIIIILCFIPLGCAFIHNKSYLDIISSWNGHHIDELVEEVGYPQQSFTAPNGNTVYVYPTYSIRTFPRWSTPMGQYMMTFGGHAKTHYCIIFFETDNNGIIVKYSYKGDACE